MFIASVLQERQKTVLDIDRSELKALLTLLEDPDTFVQEKVMERLSGLGEKNVPLLDELRIELTDGRVRKRVSELIHRITFNSFEQEFIECLENRLETLKDLEKAQLLMCRFDNPTLRTELSRAQLDNMSDRLETKLKHIEDPYDIVSVFSSFFFDDEYFRGASDDYMHPDNSYLHKVLQRRTGIPISLSLVMLFVARRLGLSFYGVNMPMHFLIRYEQDADNILIDPFNAGRIVSEDQCRAFLSGHGIVPESHHLKNATPYQIQARSIRNLIFCYDKMEVSDRVVELKRLLNYVLEYEHHRPL